MVGFQELAVPLLRLQPEWQPFLQFVRFRKRINIQRPAHPHYERDKVLRACWPVFPEPRSAVLPIYDVCQKQVEMNEKRDEVENPFRRLIAKEILNWFKHSNMVAFLHANPITSDEHFKANILLKRQNMTLKTQYGRKTMETALEKTHYEPVVDFFQARTAIIFSAEPQVGKLMRILKKVPQLVLIAGIVDNRLLSKSEMVRYSQLADLQTTRAQLVTTLNLAASQVLQHLTYHQSTLLGHLKQHVEQKKNESETNEKDS